MDKKMDLWICETCGWHNLGHRQSCAAFDMQPLAHLMLSGLKARQLWEDVQGKGGIRQHGNLAHGGLL